MATTPARAPAGAAVLPKQLTKDQEDLLKLKAGLKDFGHKQEIIKLDGPPLQPNGKPDANTGVFGRRSVFAQLAKLTGADVGKLPDELREKLPAEGDNMLYKSKTQKGVAYIESKQADGPSLWFMIRPKEEVGAAEPARPVDQVDAAAPGAAAAVRAAKMAAMQAMIGGALKRAGLPMPKAGEEVKFWTAIDQAANTPANKKKPNEGSKLHQLSVGIATLMLGDRPGALPERIDVIAGRIEMALGAESHRQLKEGYQTWAEVNAGILKAVADSDGVKGTPTKLSSPEFKTEVETLTGQKWANDTVGKVFGPGKNRAALDERIKMISGATSSIDIAVWKVYGDAVGEEFTQALLDKRAASPNVPIRITVDGNVAERDPKSMALLEKLRAAGVEVQLWKDPEHPLSGMHYKGMVVDANTDHPKAIVGGRNIGEEYLGDGKWRDTDVAYEGRGALATYANIAEVWNASAQRSGKPTIPTVTEAEIAAAKIAVRKSTFIMPVVDVPGPGDPQDVCQVLCKAIRGAEKWVNIQQGYFLQVPAVMEALKEAAARGVKIRIFSNGSDSMDVKGLDMMGKAATAELVNLPGVEIYAKKSAKDENGVPLNTLHSKFIEIDGIFFGIGSWNQHGRSLLLEAEGMTFGMDENIAGELHEDFENDIVNDAIRMTVENLRMTDDELTLVGLMTLMGVAHL